jgi:hypothetical protein
VRNDGKEIAALRDENEAAQLKQLFERWAVQPWR